MLIFFITFGIITIFIFYRAYQNNRPSSDNKTKKKAIVNSIFATRPQQIIICPNCKEALPIEYNSCFSCGVNFIFLDETNIYCGPEH